MIENTKLLNFDNLAFHKHPSCQDGIMAQLNMGDITISVVANILQGDGLYGRVEMCQETEQLDYLNGDYEVAMWRKGDSDMIPLGVGDDVLAGQTPAQVSKHMRDAQLNGDAWIDLLKKLRKDFREELGLDD
tara:strand:+ start:71 stop:466 length:396 start_codon:yes stop_codon:yes gene_type:complete